MVQSRDIIVGIILIVFLFYLLYRVLVKKADKLKNAGKSKGVHANVKRKSDLEKILSTQGYEWIQSAERQPVTIRYGEKEIVSFFQIDGLVQKDQQVYVVKRKRKAGTARMSGVSIRRELFPLYLLYEINGILYINTDNGKITTISFDFQRPNTTQGNSMWRTRILWLIMGVCLGISIILSGKS